jgi:hypothetical protein
LVKGNNGFKDLVTNTSFERNVAALLAERGETCSFERPNDAVGGNARQFGHVR